MPFIFNKERNILFQRVPPAVIRTVFDTQHSLHELHIMLLCPSTLQVASAVGFYLSCTIAKLGIFKALKASVPVIGPMHYIQCVNSYKGKWLKSYKKHKLNDLFNEVIQLFVQPRVNNLCVRSVELVGWASECVININNVYIRTHSKYTSPS